jgi:excisionase family DNA binding protein
MKPTYSTAEVARRLDVSVQTVQRWVDMGRLRAWKTLGGHRRIDADDAHLLFQEFTEGSIRSEPASTTASPAVLVVDDNTVHLRLGVALMQAVLPAAVVTTASSGFEVLLALGRQRVDVLLTDLTMPHMDGFEMLRHVAVSGPHRPRFMIATSAHSLSELHALGSLPTDVTFMPKPLELAALSAWAASAWGRQPVPAAVRTSMAATA